MLSTFLWSVPLILDQVHTSYCTCYRVFDEDDSENDERLVGNPIYSDSPPGASENRSSERDNYDILHHNVGTVGVIPPIGAYEMISNLPTQPNSAHDRDTETLQTDDASAYAKLGAEGVGENPDEDVKSGVKDNELRSPYANIFEISPSN